MKETFQCPDCGNVIRVDPVAQPKPRCHARHHLQEMRASWPTMIPVYCLDIDDAEIAAEALAEQDHGSAVDLRGRLEDFADQASRATSST